MKIKFNIFLIIIAGFLLRLILYKYGTYSLDYGTFVSWSNTLVEKGFLNFYQNSWSDYLPGYLYVLGFLGFVKQFLTIDQLFLYKLPAIIADLATTYFVYKIIKKEHGEDWARLGALFYVFNPAIILNSTLWGQVDSITALLSILSIYLLEKNVYLSSFTLAFGALVKPQVAFISPLIFVLMLRRKWSFSKIISYISLSFLIFVFGFYPFRENYDFLKFVFYRLSSSANQYPYGSVNAFNFWGFWGFWQRDDLGLLGTKTIGVLVSVILSLVLIFRNITSKENTSKIYGTAAGIFLVTFLFLTRIHERHLLPVFAPLLIFGITQVSGIIVYLGLSVTYVLNLIYAYNYISVDRSVVISEMFIKFLIFINVLLLILLIVRLFKNNDFFERLLGNLKLNKKDDSLKFTKDIDQKKAKILIIFVLGFAFMTRLVFLAKPSTEYFDEVYHAFTAKVMLHGDPKAWEWWNTPPEGFAYEWTHPPLAKLGMVLGMKIFGENSFGYRIPGAVLGTGIVLLVYLITHHLFRDRLLSVLAALIFSLEGLPLVLARIGMNDSYFLFFALLCFYFYLKDKNFWSSVAFGLSLSSKWSAIWLIPILFLSHFVLKKRITLAYIWFLVIPPIIYIGSYIPMFLSGHSFDQFIEVQKQMWWYHTKLKATHAYTSKWWTWPITLRPVYLYTSEELGGAVSRIYAFGNPIVSFFSVFAVIWTTYNAVLLKSRKLGLIIFSYLIFFVPWAVSPRIMFYYHYFPSIVFVSIISAYVLRSNKKIIIPVLTIFFVSFVYFLPHYIGLNIPLWLDKSYYWFQSWR